MVVVNVVGFPYKLRLRNGNTIVIPYDNQPHEVPDEIAENKFDNVFQVLVPPKPKQQYFIPSPIINIIKKETVSNIIEINLDDELEPEPKIEEIKTEKENITEEINKLPLKGIKIKNRDKLIKKGKSRKQLIEEVSNKVEEINNGNN